MKEFRGYVSKAQEGILSGHPAAQDYDTVPSLAETKLRAQKTVLQDSLRAEEMGETQEPVGTDFPETQSEADDSESDAQQNGQETESALTVETISLSAAEKAKSVRRTWFSTRTLILALLVNILLGCLLALVMHLDTLKAPTYVYYIELTDRPADKTTPSEAASAAETTENTAGSTHESAVDHAQDGAH